MTPLQSPGTNSSSLYRRACTSGVPDTSRERVSSGSQQGHPKAAMVTNPPNHSAGMTDGSFNFHDIAISGLNLGKSEEQSPL